MLSCPFLRKIGPNIFQKDAQQLLTFIPKCPYARRLFDKAVWSSSSFSTNSIAVEPANNDICRDVSECLLKKCPYAGYTNLTESSVCIDELSKSCDSEALTSVGLKCNPPSLKDSNGHTIPNTCALFAGWQPSRINQRRSDNPAEEQIDCAAEPIPQPNSKQSGFDYSTFFNTEVDRKKQDSTYRVFRRVLRDATHFPFADDYSSGTKRRVAVWCSNDYLGMSWHPKVQEAAISTIRKHGVGSGGTRNISGNSVLHEALEAEIADLHDKPSALVFTSCYVANEATLHTLGVRIPQLTILSDAGNHASMIHGIRTSRCPKIIYRHNDVGHLESILSQMPIMAPKLVVYETVHSMSGDVCPLESLLDVSTKHKCLNFVDEVHAVGLYGARGAGVSERDNQMHRIDAITGTLGKAFGSIGGYLAGSRELVDMIRSYASGFIFTTSLPPHTLAASRASIQLLKSDEGRQLRAEHQRRVSIVRNRLKQEGLPVIDAPSHIIPLHVGDAKLCTQIMEDLLSEHNIYVQSINYPTVDRGDERLRIAPTPHHTDQLTEQLVDALCTIWRKYDLAFGHEYRTTKRSSASA